MVLYFFLTNKEGKCIVEKSPYMYQIKVRELLQDQFEDAVKIVIANGYTENQLLPDLKDSTASTEERPFFFGATINTELVGIIGYRSTWMDFGSLSLFWAMVKPEWQKKGVGKELINHVFLHIKSCRHEPKHLLLSTAIPYYYQQFGFEIIKATKENKFLMFLDLKFIKNYPPICI